MEDEDLPLFEINPTELVARIAHRTGQGRGAVRRKLYEIGVLVRPRVAVSQLRKSREPEESLGSGVPDDTGQSGTAGMGPGW